MYDISPNSDYIPSKSDQSDNFTLEGDTEIQVLYIIYANLSDLKFIYELIDINNKLTYLKKY